MLFRAHQVAVASDPSVIVAFDTNALILPYQITAGNVTEIGKVLGALSDQKRLFVPDRVVREFTRLRDAQLAAIITSLNKRKAPIGGDMPPLISEMDGSAEAHETYKALREAQTRYISVLDKLVAEIKNLARR